MKALRFFVCLFAITMVCASCDQKKEQKEEDSVQREYKDRKREARRKEIKAYNEKLMASSTGKVDPKTGALSLEGVKHVLPRHYAGNEEITSIYAKAKVDVINDGAFQGCNKLKSIDVNSYTVGVDAFKDCVSLESAHLGESSWWLREGSFAGCPKLKSVLLGICMKKIEDGAFEGSQNVTELSVPNNMKKYFFRYFSECTNIQTLYLLVTEFYDVPHVCPITNFGQVTLYVPDALIAQFQADSKWSQCGKILPLSKSKYYNAKGNWK